MVAEFLFDGNADDTSGNGFHGTGGQAESPAR
jgi:hypothetical protein